jgi:hypothetical protein
VDTLYLSILAAVVTTLGWAIIPWPVSAQRKWELIAKALGLHVGPPERAFPGIIAGELGGYGVEIKSSGLGVLVTVQSHGEIPKELRIRGGTRPIVEASPLVALAAMTPEVGALGENVMVEEGEVRQFIEGPATTQVIDAARRLVVLCGALSYVKKPLHHRLLSRMEAHPALEILQALLASEVPEVRERAIELGLVAPDHALVLEAALHAGERGIPVLKKLLEDGNDPIRAKALLGLGTHAPPVIALLPGAGPWLRAAIARAAGERAPSEGTERALLRLLDDIELEVQIEAARALGRIGTVASVEKLVYSLDMLLAPARLRLAAYEAMNAIQSRAGTADRGRLSVVQARDESGAVGFPES